MTRFHKADERFMRAALAEARKGLGKTSPNPAVGAVLVAGGKIISHGHHRGAGRPHAEIECLTNVPARDRARSTMYVTLEPCSTRGRTGACTKRIIESGIKIVVIGAIDPNPLHNGRGIDELRNAGIDVRSGVLADECSALNEAFNKWIVTKRPFVIAKCGMSLDGRLTRRPGEPRFITSAAARRDARRLRAYVDAILVGAETIRADDPQLNVRGVRGARQPLIVVLTRSGKLPKNAKIFRERTAVYRDQALQDVLVDLGRKEITSVFIEGGGEILGQALDARLIDKVQIYLGPIFTGGSVMAFGGRGAGTTGEGLRLDRVTYRKIDNDICATAYVNFEQPRARDIVQSPEQGKHRGGERVKKFLLIALAVVGLSMAAAPSSDAGVYVNFGFGGFGYPYPYYGYGYGYPYPYYGSRVVVVRRPHYFWRHGRRLVRWY